MELKLHQTGAIGSARPTTFRSIQALRGLAAVLVVIFHAGLRFDLTQTTFRVGNAGVDIFFVISGFVMWTVTTSRPTGPAQFLYHRFVRLVPLYWVFTLALAASAAVLPRAFPHMRPDLAHLLLSLAFVPHVSPDIGMVAPLLGQGWTLNFEMFFYLLFAAMLTLPRPARLPAIAVVLVSLAVIGLFASTQAQPLTTLLSPLLVEFLGGIALARAVTSGVRPGRAECWGVVAAGSALLAIAAPDANDEWARLLQYGLPAWLIVGGLVAAELGGFARFGRLTGLLGDASYSIYLSHTFTISILGKLWPEWLPPWTFMIGASLAAVLVGIAVYRTLERPILRLMRGRPAPAAPVRLATDVTRC